MENALLQRVINIVDWLIFEKKIKNRRDLADKLGYTESSLSQILNGSVALSQKFINKLSNYNRSINKRWIETGEGKMLKDQEPTIVVNEDCSQYGSKEALLMTIHSLSETINRQSKRIEELENELNQNKKVSIAQEGDAGCADAG